MSLVSLKFIAFFVITILVYYVVPKRRQWITLLLSSLCFYFLMTSAYTFIFVIISVLTVYMAGRYLDRPEAAHRKLVYFLSVTTNMGILFLLKYLNFFSGGRVSLQWMASLGISFYTLQVVGYLTDIYWGVSHSQKNIGKMALFSSFYPQMISGPISRYHDLEESLFGEHRFEWKNIEDGFYRILLGFFKKLVVAEHLPQIIENIYSAPKEYGGIFVWVATLLYVVQLYADFSGCMDIVIGVSRCYGITLVENFDMPFTSKSIQEFWQRWHITLGTWLKEYVMYPILRSTIWNKMGKKIKKKYGKKAAKMVPTFLGMLILWLAMGLWHGGGWNYIFEGIWFWLVIVLGQLFHPIFDKVLSIIKIRTDSRGWLFFQRVRTAVIFGIGILFFRADSLTNAFALLRSAFSIPSLIHSGQMLIPSLRMLDNQVGTVYLGWSIVSVLVGLVVMIVCGKNKAIISDKTIPVRLIMIYGLLFAILIFGVYGPGYSASEFIYGGF